MAAFHGAHFPKDLLTSLSAEVLYIILSYLPAKSLLNVSECNRRLRDLCQNCNSLWKHLSKVSWVFRLLSVSKLSFASVFSFFTRFVVNLCWASFYIENSNNRVYILSIPSNEDSVQILLAFLQLTNFCNLKHRCALFVVLPDAFFSWTFVKYFFYDSEWKKR